MALHAVGLKTQIWNNNIKSFLFLLCYPFIITFTYVAILGIVLFYVAMDFHAHTSTAELTKLFQSLVLDYWYVPYVLTILFLAGMFWYNHNRLDIGKGMHIVTREGKPELYGMLENLCISRGLPVPYFFIQQHPSCNAYTTGLSPSSYRIVVTSGLLEKLSPDEVECVLAHELTHIINGDTRLVFLTSTVTNMFRTLADMVWPASPYKKIYYKNGMPDQISIDNRRLRWRKNLLRLCIGGILKLADLGSLFTQLLISRKREFIADAGAVELTKHPRALMAALKKVGENSSGFADKAIKPTLFDNHENRWFSTHPSIADRVAAIARHTHVEAEDRAAALEREMAEEKRVVW